METWAIKLTLGPESTVLNGPVLFWGCGVFGDRGWGSKTRCEWSARSSPAAARRRQLQQQHSIWLGELPRPLFAAVARRASHVRRKVNGPSLITAIGPNADPRQTRQGVHGNPVRNRVPTRFEAVALCSDSDRNSARAIAPSRHRTQPWTASAQWARSLRRCLD